MNKLRSYTEKKLKDQLLGNKVMENKVTFRNRLRPFFAPSDQLLIMRAYRTAKFAHRAQTRNELFEGKPTRYFEHVRRTAIIMMDELKVMDRDGIITCLLHDVLEDTEDFDSEVIEYDFGKNVCHMSQLLSKVPKEGYKDRLNNCHEWMVLLVKFCDRTDNCRSLMVPGNTIEFQKRQIKETVEEYLPLFEHMLTLIPEIYKPLTTKMVRDLDRLIHGYAACLQTTEKLAADKQ